MYWLSMGSSRRTTPSCPSVTAPSCRPLIGGRATETSSGTDRGRFTRAVEDGPGHPRRHRTRGLDARRRPQRLTRSAALPLPTAQPATNPITTPSLNFTMSCLPRVPATRTPGAAGANGGPAQEVRTDRAAGAASAVGAADQKAFGHGIAPETHRRRDWKAFSESAPKGRRSGGAGPPAPQCGAVPTEHRLSRRSRVGGGRSAAAAADEASEQPFHGGDRPLGGPLPRRPALPAPGLDAHAALEILVELLVEQPRPARSSMATTLISSSHVTERALRLAEPTLASRAVDGHHLGVEHRGLEVPDARRRAPAAARTRLRRRSGRSACRCGARAAGSATSTPRSAAAHSRSPRSSSGTKYGVVIRTRRSRQLQQRAEQRGHVAPARLRRAAHALHDGGAGLGLVREAVDALVEQAGIGLGPVVEEGGPQPVDGRAPRCGSGCRATRSRRGRRRATRRRCRRRR